jgi:hypothetical protein
MRRMNYRSYNIHTTKSVKLIKPSILRGFTGVMLQI